MRNLLLLSVLALCGAGPAWSATATLPPGAVLVENVRSLDVDARAAALDASLAVGGEAAAIEALAALTDPVQREATAARLLDRLQQRGAALPEALLETLAGWPVLVYCRHEETAADWFVPVFDLPGKVLSLRLLQARDHEVSALLASIPRKRGDDALTSLAQASPQAAALAIAAAPAATFDTLRARSKSASAMLPSPALAALAKRAADAETFLHALDAATPLDVLPLFASTLPALSPVDADAVLRDALARPDYASTAAFALVQREGPQADEYFLRSLLAAADTGPSVAAALAQAPQGLARIDALLVDADATTLTHLALALRLRGDAGAEQRLAALRDDPRVPASVRAELQR